VSAPQKAPTARRASRPGGGRLAGKVALVTGAGQGVGRGVALALAAEGAAITITGRTESKLRAVAAEIEDRGARAHCVVGDVGLRADVERMVDACAETFGRLDVLVNNAQSSVQRLLKDTDDDDVDLAYRTGPLATFHAMRAALPHLRESAGSVVNFGSSAAVEGERGFASYAMAKEAIRGLTRVAAREWGAYGIRVNAICPAALSPAAEEFRDADPDRFARIIAQIPLGRMGDPEGDIGRAVVSLASDDMAYLTGATLMLCGGRTLLG
jgi:2-hydroxycyclohexanecarboxyl-CoA dehydrogenase